MKLTVSPSIEKLKPYVPGKPIEETQREFGLSYVVKLASNENPLGPSPMAQAAAQKSLSQLHRYPDPGCYRLRKALEVYYQTSSDKMIFGNGSNELIDLLVRTFCEPGSSTVLTSESAFIAYKICAQAARVSVIETPRLGFGFDLEEMSRRVQEPSHSIKLVFIANPNNPTGTFLEKEALLAFIKQCESQDILVVIDEAYSEFIRGSNYTSLLGHLDQFSNLIVLKTFSKAFALASLRLGVMFSSPSICSYVQKVRNPFNVNDVAQAAAEASVQDEAFLRKSAEVVHQGLDFFYKGFKSLGLPYVPSQGNFVLVDVGQPSDLVFTALLKQGVIVRPVKEYGFSQHLRISVGLPDENQFAWEKMKLVLGHTGIKGISEKGEVN